MVVHGLSHCYSQRASLLHACVHCGWTGLEWQVVFDGHGDQVNGDGGGARVMSKVKLTNGEDTVMTLEIVARSPKATSSPWNMSDTSATLKAYTTCDRW